MTKFEMTCSCGEVMSIDAGDRNEAVAKLKGMMNEAGIKAHMSSKHKSGEPVHSVEQVHDQIESNLKVV